MKVYIIHPRTSKNSSKTFLSFLNAQFYLERGGFFVMNKVKENIDSRTFFQALIRI